jgi:hypothetical protein
MSSTTAIAVDLVGPVCRVAIWDSNRFRPRLLANAMGERTTPIAVAYRGTAIETGAAALASVASDGRFHLVERFQDRITSRSLLPVDGPPRTAFDAAAEFLRHMKHGAEAQTGRKADRFLLVIPADSDALERDAWLNAAAAGGLCGIELVDDLVAIFESHARGRHAPDRGSLTRLSVCLDVDHVRLGVVGRGDGEWDAQLTCAPESLPLERERGRPELHWARLAGQIRKVLNCRSSLGRSAGRVVLGGPLAAKDGARLLREQLNESVHCPRWAAESAVIGAARIIGRMRPEAPRLAESMVVTSPPATRLSPAEPVPGSPPVELRETRVPASPAAAGPSGAASLGGIWSMLVEDVQKVVSLARSAATLAACAVNGAVPKAIEGPSQR